MFETALMLIVLIVGYLVMLGLVKFAEHVIERPRLAKRNETIATSSADPVSR